MRLKEPRQTFTLIKGDFTRPGERVAPATPAVLHPFRVWWKENGPSPRSAPVISNAAPTRLDLARWIVDPANPLTARVTVNRIWQQHFGRGLVGTASDFGNLGDKPSHPELLDWLTQRFIEDGWSVKKLQRLILTSAAYHQSSRITPELLARDPENRLLARGPRFRMDAEMVRDAALAVSGLLLDKQGADADFQEGLKREPGDDRRNLDTLKRLSASHRTVAPRL